MITPMKKISIMCLAKDREDALSRLQDLGLLHITPVKPPDESTLPRAVEKYEEAKVALDTLECESHHSQAGTDATRAEIDEIITEIYERHQQYRHLEEHLNNLRALSRHLRPYGNFKPQTIRDLAQKGITVKLYHARNIESLDFDDSMQLVKLSSDKTGTYFALIADHDFSIENATEFHLPEKSLEEVMREKEAVRAELSEIKRQVCAFTGVRDKIEETLHAREEAISYARVHDTLGKHGRLVYLQGFAPADSVDEIRTAARQYGWGILEEDPSEDDHVPTLLRLPRWVKPIKALLDMLEILPGYREADISSIFLVFFSIFFGILIGDAGYGILFLAATLYARKKMPKAPAYPFVLFGILSACTILWGLLTGNWFGINPDALPSLLRGLRIGWLTDQNNIMQLCFMIGAIHLSVAHIWNMIVLAPDKRAISQLGWIGLVWSMYFVACNMVLQAPLPGFFTVMLVGSIALIMLFMNPLKDVKKEMIHYIMFPLTIVNCFVDVVSYIRLFAVGLASVSVAMSFNNMAMGLGWQKIWTIPLMAIILLLGHGLNIILCALGILVHGVRLNTLEFSMHKDIQWKGLPYNPFSRKKNAATET